MLFRDRPGLKIVAMRAGNALPADHCLRASSDRVRGKVDGLVINHLLSSVLMHYAKMLRSWVELKVRGPHFNNHERAGRLTIIDRIESV